MVARLRRREGFFTRCLAIAPARPSGTAPIRAGPKAVMGIDWTTVIVSGATAASAGGAAAWVIDRQAERRILIPELLARIEDVRRIWVEYHKAQAFRAHPSRFGSLSDDMKRQLERIDAASAPFEIVDINLSHLVARMGLLSLSAEFAAVNDSQGVDERKAAAAAHAAGRSYDMPALQILSLLEVLESKLIKQLYRRPWTRTTTITEARKSWGRRLAEV